MTAVIYTRISSDRDGMQLGVERQKSDCLQFAEKHDLEVLEVITDNDTSAYRRTKPRPGWNRVKALVREGAVDSVVVWHADRLYRHPADLEDIIDLVDGRQLSIHTVTAGELDLNTPTGRMVARLLGSVARNEVEHKSERQARKHLEIAQKGQWHGGIVPTGYRRTEMKGQLLINEPEATLVREAAARILAGHSLTATTMWFREKSGRVIKPNTLKGILTGPTVAGLRMHTPQATRDRQNQLRHSGTAIQGVPTHDGVYEATWDAILDRQTWNELRAVLLDPKRRRKGKQPEKSLLSGLLRCGRCEHVLGFSALSYKCTRNVGGCGKLGISTPAIEGFVTALVEELIESSHLEIEQRSVNGTTDSSPNWEERRTVFLELFREGQITRSELTEQLNQIQSRMEDVRQQQDEQYRISASTRQLVQGIDQWAKAELATRRVVIAQLIDKIIVQPSAGSRSSGARFDETRVQVLWNREESAENAYRKPSERF